jgi:hypothetical protein
MAVWCHRDGQQDFKDHLRLFLEGIPQRKVHWNGTEAAFFLFPNGVQIPSLAATAATVNFAVRRALGTDVVPYSHQADHVLEAVQSFCKQPLRNKQLRDFLTAFLAKESSVADGPSIHLSVLPMRLAEYLPNIALFVKPDNLSVAEACVRLLTSGYLISSEFDCTFCVSQQWSAHLFSNCSSYGCTVYWILRITCLRKRKSLLLWLLLYCRE